MRQEAKDYIIAIITVVNEKKNRVDYYDPQRPRKEDIAEEKGYLRACDDILEYLEGLINEV